MYTLRCPYCGQEWIGEDELEAEIRSHLYPCTCVMEIDEIADEDFRVLVYAEMRSNSSEVHYAS
jgi:sarcosine oxidase delta subunit